MVPGDRPLIDIGYKYNTRKVLSFIVTDNVGTTKTGIPIYTSILTNLLMFPFVLLIVPLLYLKKSAVNEVDSYNKSRQSDLALDKWWVNQCDWLWLCMTVYMGMTIHNFWKLFPYGVKRDQYDKLIGIREFSEKTCSIFLQQPFFI